MKRGIATALCATALLWSPAYADPASEAFVKDQLQALNADPDWSVSTSSIGSEDADTVVEGLNIGSNSPKATLTAKEVRAANLKPDKEGGFTFSGGEVSSLRLVAPSLALVVPGTRPGQPDETLSIGSLGASGIRALDPTAFSELFKLDPHAKRAVHIAAMEKALSALPKVGHFAIGDVTLGNNHPLKMQSLTFNAEGYLGPFPLPYHVDVTGLALPGLFVRAALKHIDPRVAQIFQTLDSTVFNVDVTAGEEWQDEATGEVRAIVHATIDNGATVDLIYHYVGVSGPWLASVSNDVAFGDLGHGIKGFENLKLKDLTLRVSDRTVLNQIFGSIADQLSLGIDGAAYRKQIAMFAMPLFMLALGHPELADTFLQPMQQFLGEGKTLVVKLQPAQPVSAVDIANATASHDTAALMDLLNLTMTTEEPTVLQ